MNRAAVPGVSVLGFLGVLSTGLFAAEPVSRSPLGLLAAQYVFPSSANATGLYEATFRTRMVLTNPTGSRSFFAVGEVWTEKAGARFSTPLVGMSIEDRIVNTSIGESGISISTGLRVNASNRANFGCANMDAAPVDVRADFYNGTSTGRGDVTKSVTLALPANGWAHSAVPVSGEKIRILFTQLSSGGGAGTYCYGVNVDNLSNDGTSIPALYAPDVR